jgi:serine/threonine protein kinase/Tfp pilus assembly protein PilF
MSTVDRPTSAEPVDGSASLPPWLASLSGLAPENKPLSSLSMEGKSAQVDEAYQEYCRRSKAGEEIDPDEFCAQHSHLKSTLARLLEVHQWLEQNPQLVESLPPRWPQAGEDLLDLHIIGELGRGGFARVYLATQPALGHRPVAVKLSRGGGAEAQTLGRISHANIVPVYSVQEDPLSGMTAVCMPYLGSATLCDVIDRCSASALKPDAPATAILDAVVDHIPVGEANAARQPPPQLLAGTYIDGAQWVGAQLADALRFIHERGICHHDLKPSNVLMTPDGRPMLLDFNLCADQHTVNPRRGGTLLYMSPEQLRATERISTGVKVTVDARSDLYSLGVMLYELLSGKLPFGSVPLAKSPEEARQLVLARQQSGFVPLRRVNPNVRPRLARLIESCLAQDPEDRPPSAAEVAAELSYRAGPWQRLSRWVVQHPRWTLAMLVLGLSVVAAAGMALWQLKSEEPQPLGQDSGSPTARRERSVEAKQWSLGQQAFAQQRYSEALFHFGRVLDTNPDNPVLLMARGRTYQMMAETKPSYFQSAFQDYDTADKIQPDGPANARMGYCLLRMTLTKPARDCFEKALALEYKTAVVYNNLAYCCGQLGDVYAGKHHADRAIELQRDLMVAYHNRAFLQFLQLHDLAGRLQGTTTVAKRRVKAIYPHIMELAKADMAKALQIGPPNVELFRDACWVWAKSAEMQPDDIGPAVKHLRAAMDLGYEPNDGVFISMLKHFPANQDFTELRQRPKTGQPMPPTFRIVDPG